MGICPVTRNWELGWRIGLFMLTLLESEQPIELMGAEEIQRALGQIEGKLDQALSETARALAETKEMSDALMHLEEKHDQRISTLEKAYWKALGILTIGGLFASIGGDFIKNALKEIFK